MSRLKQVTERARKENILIEQTRKREVDKAPGKKITRAEIEKAIKPKRIKEKKIEATGEKFLLKPQEKHLAVPAKRLIPIIAKSYKKKKKELFEKNGYHRTSLQFRHAISCPRSVNFDFFCPHKARKYTIKGHVLNKDGSMHHEDIQERIKKACLQQEGFLNLKWLNIAGNGRYDGLVFVDENEFTAKEKKLAAQGWKIVDLLEIKTKYPGASNKLQQADYDQAQLYHLAAQHSETFKDNKIYVRNIIILYKDRSTQTDEIYFEWAVQPDKDRQADIIQYLKFLWHRVVEQKFLPPHPYLRDSSKCEFCRYHAYCWKDFPEIIKEAKVEEFEEIEVPGYEIVKSHALKVFDNKKEIAKMKEQNDEIEPVLIAFFLKQQREGKPVIIPVTDSECLYPKQGKRSVWNEEKLVENLGFSAFAKIASPSQKKINALVKQHYIDTTKIEECREVHLNKPSVSIRKMKEGE